MFIVLWWPTLSTTFFLSFFAHFNLNIAKNRWLNLRTHRCSCWAVMTATLYLEICGGWTWTSSSGTGYRLRHQRTLFSPLWPYPAFPKLHMTCCRWVPVGCTQDRCCGSASVLMRIRIQHFRPKRHQDFDDHLDCCTAVPGSIPPPGTPPSENFSRKPSAVDLLIAGRITPAKKILWGWIL